ncbi:FG-GAP repeat protein [Paremcibacter congregatus]|uniref:Integrin n=1 Tax=Paremcibacter congregatus TaxID=2043170 RepID=A0A2G4YQ66_9PROT|nr:FG-GAP repeat protein [Paremcibacter congregatus]PHZ84471.1 hypothetical protein CRD36_11725 [Paremcibacter congregatus]QDE28689.1 hypothetical protein FIV45_16135 [Paremcibacter congregatus]
MQDFIRPSSNKIHFMGVVMALLLSLTLAAGATASDQAVKLLAHDGAPEDFFGFDVAISGDTLVVGALKSDDDIKGVDTGSAYIFTRDGNTWGQQAKLVAADGRAGDTFGGKVFLSGDTAIIGASHDDDKGIDSGAAYIFTRKGTTWNQQAKITATDGMAGDAFGQSIAFAGDTLVIGAPHDNDRGDNSGSVYVFTRANTGWDLQTKLTAADGAAGDVFGISVAYSDDTLVVGADLNDEKALNAGAVYVLTRSGGHWSQQAKLTAADGAETDIFGVRVALSGDTVLISARRDDDDVMGIDSGSAYVFTRSGTTWRQQAKLTASDGAANDRFGRSIALEGNIAVIGAMLHDQKGPDAGTAYVFTRSGEAWQQKTKLTTADGAAGNAFGWSMALSNGAAVIAARHDHGTGSGAVYLFDVRRWQ